MRSPTLNAPNALASRRFSFLHRKGRSLCRIHGALPLSERGKELNSGTAQRNSRGVYGCGCLPQMTGSGSKRPPITPNLGGAKTYAVSNSKCSECTGQPLVLFPPQKGPVALPNTRRATLVRKRKRTQQRNSTAEQQRSARLWLSAADDQLWKQEATNNSEPGWCQNFCSTNSSNGCVPRLAQNWVNRNFCSPKDGKGT